MEITTPSQSSKLFIAPVALYDANVLYPAFLRDTLVQLATQGIVQARWTDQIHDEWIRNILQDRPDISPSSLARTRRLMNFHVPRATIENYEFLIPTLQLPDENDRHVLAAAIHAKARFIVTFNLEDFPTLVLAQHGIQAIAPDAFLSELFVSNRGEMLAALKTQRSRMKNPPLTSDKFLETLSRQGLPNFVAALRNHQNEI